MAFPTHPMPSWARFSPGGSGSSWLEQTLFSSALKMNITILEETQREWLAQRLCLNSVSSG